MYSDAELEVMRLNNEVGELKAKLVEKELEIKQLKFALEYYQHEVYESECENGI